MDHHLARQRRMTWAKARAGRTAFGAVAVAAGIGSALAQPASASAARPQSGLQAESKPDAGADARTATPIHHLVVIYQENHSFDNYFGTYPLALNPARRTAVPRRTRHARPSTGSPRADRTDNPNLASPFRLDRSDEITCDNNHGYVPMQKAYDSGLARTSSSSPWARRAPAASPSLTMDYYDGNTVTALWNYAQRFAMSDNNFASTYRPVRSSALNLVCGQTARLRRSAHRPRRRERHADRKPPARPRRLRRIRRGQPDAMQMTGHNIGDLLNAKDVTWGWFTRRFKPTATVNGTASAAASHTNIGGGLTTTTTGERRPVPVLPVTANPAPPAAEYARPMIGRSDQANHQYDLSDFWTAADATAPARRLVPHGGELPARATPDTPTRSTSRHFLVDTLNRSAAASVLALHRRGDHWDESDGWYDHVMPPDRQPVQRPAEDVFTGAGQCGIAGTPRRLPGPLRLRPATSPSGHLARTHGRTS